MREEFEKYCGYCQCKPCECEWNTATSSSMSDDKKPREWTAIFSDFQDLSSGILQDEPWLGGSNMTSTFKVIEKPAYQKAVDDIAIAVEALEFVKSRTHSDPLLIEELNVRAARVYEAVNKALAKIKGEK